ncbi:MAG: hypothetical protein FJX59_13480 [Alphaproteobacteria bacterium]|nr:hypothetical protein [Alphaproteobacteria bacterium]
MTETLEQAVTRLCRVQLALGFQLVAIHPYGNTRGEPLYWKIRLKHKNGEKWIRPVHFDGERYVMKEPEHPSSGKLLYALDRIKSNPAAAVWVVEGEQKADALNGLGLIATTSGSATSANGADWRPLSGRNIIIWPDHDDPGLSYAADVTRILSKIGCRVEQLDVAQLGLDTSGDVVDWLKLHPTAKGTDIESLPRRTSTPATEQYIDKTESLQPLTSGTVVELLCASTVTPRPIDWIWDGWLSGGKLHILGGNAGTGKTTIALALAAIITTGGQWPDGTKSSVGDVLIWSGEDDAEDSLVPRLIACGADLSRVHFVSSATESKKKRSFDPARDIPALAAKIENLRNLRLLIIDPVVSAVVRDSHKNADVRQGLQPLVNLGIRARCAVLGITHYSKATSGLEPLERITGSLAFGAVPRIVMGTVQSKDQGCKRRFVRIKSNVGPDGDGFEYDLDRKEIPNCTSVVGQFVVWGQKIEGTASKLVNDLEIPDSPAAASTSSRDAAKHFLIRLLSKGALTTTEVETEAKDAGFAQATVRRAKDDLGIKPFKGLGAGAPWYWQLPGTDANPQVDPKILSDAIDDHPESESTFDADEHLSDPEQSSRTATEDAATTG